MWPILSAIEGFHCIINMASFDPATCTLYSTLDIHVPPISFQTRSRSCPCYCVVVDHLILSLIHTCTCTCISLSLFFCFIQLIFFMTPGIQERQHDLLDIFISHSLAFDNLAPALIIIYIGIYNTHRYMCTCVHVYYNTYRYV